MMREALCKALALHAGKQLTMEVAQAIVVSLLGDRAPLDLSAYRPLRTEAGYIIQAERLASNLMELDRLHKLHWLETEKHRHGLALNPDYNAMVAIEDAGRLLQLTVRSPIGLMVGHLRLYLARSLHTQTIYAEEDSLFIESCDRGGWTAMHLLRYAEQCLWAIPEVQEIRVDSKLANRADVLMKRMRYQPTALRHVKYRPKESTHVQ